MVELLSQAPEVLHNIFRNVETTDLASLAKTCSHLNRLIHNDELLWKVHYLSRFDPPLEKDEPESWRSRLTRLVNLQKILESDNDEVKTSSLEEVLTQTIRLAAQSIPHPTSPKIPSFLATLFEKPININHFLCRSSLFARARPRQWPAAPSEDLRQLSAQLHVLGGMNLEPAWPSPDQITCPHIAHHRENGRIVVSVFEPASEDSDDSYEDIDDDEDDDDEPDPTSRTANGTNQVPRSVHTTPPYPVRQTHAYARSRVYDLRRYNAANMWGPFMDDGSQRIDWEKVQAIMVDIAYNHRVYTERRGLNGADFLPASTISGGTSSSSGSGSGSGSGSSSTGPSSSTRSQTASQRNGNSVLRPWDEPFAGFAAGSMTSLPLSGALEPSLHPDLDLLDPYGVTGTWMRIVCFLDYNDLYAFNFENLPIPPGQERDPITTREAFRLIRLQLNVTKVEAPGEDDGQELPVVHFEGSSRSTFMAWDPNANSRIRGTVRQAPTGAIRWTTFSITHGEERWRSEGVQIGGPRSARGIVGNWFDKDYAVHGPAGPTAFWKISDDMVEEKRREPLPQMLQIIMAE